MEKTKIIITVVIEHDSELAKEQAIETLNLEKGKHGWGHNGIGDTYDLTVENVEEIKVK
jgi:hypothetical protein